MFVNVKVYYQECPNCGDTWSEQLSKANVIRLGKEFHTCKCDRQWPTGHTEWAHLTPRQRRRYFVSEAEIGVLAISTGTPLLFAPFLAQRPLHGAVTAAAYGLLFGLAFDAVLWFLKATYVRLSLRRVPHPDQAELRGPLPWQW